MKEKIKSYIQEFIRIICLIFLVIILSCVLCDIFFPKSDKKTYERLLKEYNAKFKDNIEKSKSNLDSFKTTIDTIYINNTVRVNKIQYIKQKQLKNREYVDSLFNSIKFDIDTCDTLYLRLYNQVLKEIEKQ